MRALLDTGGSLLGTADDSYYRAGILSKVRRNALAFAAGTLR